jgi:hypothetical protein
VLAARIEELVPLGAAEKSDLDYSLPGCLLERVLLKPLPQTVPERYASRHDQTARELHEQFWETRSGPPRPA